MFESFRGAIVWVSLTGLLAGLVLAFQVRADESLMRLADRPDEEAMVFSIELDRFTLTDGTLIFQDFEEIETFWLPLGNVMTALELQVQVDPEAGRAEGWIYSEDRTFHLDLETRVLEIDGRHYDLSPDEIERHFDDIYVRMDVLESWLPLHLEVNYRRLAIKVTTIEPLPIEERFAAQERRNRIRPGRNDFDGPVTGPEHSFSPHPFFDINSSTRLRRNPDRRSERTQLRSSYTVQSSATIADQDFSGIVTGRTTNTNGLQEPRLRMTIGRQSMGEALLGVPGLRSYSAGDVRNPRLSLVANNTVGRGFYLSSFGSQQRIRGNRITLRGDLPTGWDVEVYRDGEILDFQTEPDPDGRYEFEDLRTRSGLNVFRLIFFGPQGQRREEVERFFLNGQQTEPGNTQYEIAVNQARRNLIEIENISSNQDSFGALRGTAIVEHGLSQRLAGTAGLTTLVTPDRAEDGLAEGRRGTRRTFVNLGLRGSLGGVFGELDTAFNAEGGLGAGLSLQTRFDHYRLNLEHREFKGLDSEISNVSGNRGIMRRTSEIELSGLPDLPLLGRTPVTGRGNLIETETGLRSASATGRLSTRLANFRQTFRTRWTFESGGDPERRSPTEGDLTLRVGTDVGPVNLRGAARYDIAPEAQFATADITADWDITRRIGLRAGFSNAISSGTSTITGGVNWSTDSFAIGLNGDFDTNRNISALFSLRFGFGTNPRSGRSHVRAENMSRFGAVVPRAFIDRNATGRFDPGDQLLENVQFRGRGLGRSDPTDESGSIMMPGVRPYRTQVLEIEERSLEDPFLKSVNSEQGFYVRPGQATYLDFPIVPTGEIDGMVTIVTEGRERAGRGVRLELVNKDGQVVREELVTYDGYFYLGEVPYGSYTLRPARDHDISVPIVLNAENDFAWDTNFIIERD